MLECVVNLSEGRDEHRLAAARMAAGPPLLDLHRDPDHHRAVLTIAAADDEVVFDAVCAVARWAVATLDLRQHEGAHPRFGVLDVVPWVDLHAPRRSATPGSCAARDRFAAWAAAELALPCFLYGPERSLPDVRRRAWQDLAPDTGPPRPHPSAGAAAVGARGVLVAYNLWLAGTTVETARQIAARVRRPGIRTLGLAVGDRLQVSCNLTDPLHLGPAEAYDLVAAEADASGARIASAELVGLVPRAVLQRTDARRWPALDLSEDRTIEARLAP